jgi:twitching motility two-component system response regulator PilH
MAYALKQDNPFLSLPSPLFINQWVIKTDLVGCSVGFGFSLVLASAIAKSLSLFIEVLYQFVVRSQTLGDRGNKGNFMCLALVVDDDPTQQLIISKLLSKVGLDVIIASDGVEALEQIQSKSPVLVILDILMPRMNGHELCQQLKANEKTQHLPVLMYSGQEQEFNLKQENKLKPDAYLSKVCHPQELVNTVHQLLLSRKKKKSPSRV